MSQSLSKIYLHLIFHIKSNSPKVLDGDLERLFSYLGQLVNNTGCKNIWIGGMCDHIHLLFLLSRDASVSNVVQDVKRNSSRWIKSVSPHYRQFAWQGGYAVFSVSQSVVEKTLRYIQNQRVHHQKHTYEEEYKMFLESYNINYDAKHGFSD